jgi:mono/diheme cytochrome c family protein
MDGGCRQCPASNPFLLTFILRTAPMKKPILCGSAAILITSLTVGMLTTAEPRVEREMAASAASHQHKNVDAKAQATIERGRYLIKTAGCNDCHTPGYAQTAGDVPEAQWLIGDALGYQGPWGTTYPINVRQFMQSLTEAQWLAIARNPARPPMPWFALRDMTDEDLSALYRYVRTLGPSDQAVPAYVEPGKPVNGPVVRWPE